MKLVKKEDINNKTYLNDHLNNLATTPFISTMAKTFLPQFNNNQNFNYLFPKEINQIFRVQGSLHNDNNSFYKTHDKNIISQISQRKKDM